MGSDPVLLRPTIDRAWLEHAAASDPVAHAFALWDLDQYPERVRFVSAADARTTLGYLLVWLGHPAGPVVHWFGAGPGARQLLDALPPRPLVAIVPEPIGPDVERARGPARSIPLLTMVAEAPPSGSSPGDWVVRRLGGEDRTGLARWVAGRTDPVVVEYAQLDPAREVIWGAFAGGSLLGVLRAEVRLPAVWLLGGVYVAPEARGRGAGQALVRTALAAARDAGASTALFVRADRPAARAVYERAGFRARGRRLWIDAGAGLEP